MLADLRSRLTFCPRLTAVVRTSLFFLLTLLVLLSNGLLSNRALGQSPELPSEPSLAEQQELSRVVLQHLRSGETAKALKALEPAGEWPAKIAMTEANPLGPACAGLHRALSQLSSEEQFDLLSSWSILAGSNRIRVLTALVPTGTPPPEFARVLGERPRPTSFPVSSIGNVRGIYCSAWSLVAAARETGRLKKLITALTPLVENKTPNADLLLTLAQMAEGRGENARLQEQLSQRASQLQAAVPATGVGPKFIDSADVVLAAACLSHPLLRPLSEEMFDSLLASTYGQTARILRPFLRQAHATAVLVNRGQSDPALALAPRFKYWVPVSGDMAGPNPMWLTHDDHVLHLAGSGYDVLYFRYPLQGAFEFHCDTQSGGRYETEGGLVFGGLHYQPLSVSFELGVSDTEGTPAGKRYCYFVYPGRRPAFHHLSIDSSHSATISVNRHPMWNDPNATHSPWLGLQGLEERRPLFRNFKLTGHPIIPRAVSLTAGETLRGWQNLVDGNVQPSAGSVGWRLSAGVIEAAGDAAAASRVENLLSFQRPLVGGESVSYEFLHVPGMTEVSPALGRVVFLLQADGVRLHWMTNGRREWTGLDADNNVVEPLNRRGPRPLPFKVNDWNRVTLTRSEQSVTLSLNDVAIYQRPIDWSGDLRFGLYRHRTAPNSQVQNGAQVRNVVLTGDWPETIPQEFHENPTATVGAPLPVADRHALNRIFHDDFLSENVFAVRRRALAMSPGDRFEFLSRWVLPGQNHAGFRVTGEFTPTRPPPVALEPGPVEPGTAEPELGGRIVSPVYDWLDAARALGRLAECRRRVEAASIDVNDLDPQIRVLGLQDRARAALLMLLSIEQGDAAAIATDFEKLYALLKTQVPIGIEDQWPETLAADRGSSKQTNWPGVQELVSYLHAQRVLQWRPKDIGVWHTHIAALRGRWQRRNSTVSDSRATEFNEWIRVVAARSATCGQGFPNPEWQRRGSQVVKLAGHDEDLLLYHQPLSGDFEVEFDFIEPSHYPTQVLLAGTFTGFRYDLKHLDVGTIRGASPLVPLDQPLNHQGGWVRCRGVVRDGKRRIFLNGQQVQSDSLPENADPWVAIRGWGRFHSSFRNFRITGHPSVMEAVPLSGSKDLVGWFSYHDEAVAGGVGGWKHLDDPHSSGVILGHSAPGLAGTHEESLLRYLRPLVEDGTIDYEFFYKPGVQETHPALDRLALLLDPSGVREHWITDRRYDRTDLDPSNSVERPQNRRGTGALPLKADDWNRVRLTLRGPVLTINLNGQLVYERELEPANQRTFGLFHFFDLSEVRARNVVMRGAWSKSLLPVAEQELAGTWNTVDADVARLPARFTHDFQKDGLPDKYFRLPAPTNDVRISPESEGLRVALQASGASTKIEIKPRFALSGDFDIEATFDRLHVETQKRETGIFLLANMNDARKSEYGISRVLTDKGFHGSQLSKSLAQADGTRSWQGEWSHNGAASGRLRLARRGDRLHYLFAEGDSEIFRTFQTEPAIDADTQRDGVKLQSFSNGIGQSDVIWKKLVLRAERMTWFPDHLPESATLMLRVMNSDGTGLKTILTPAALGLTHLGSPEWSPDGRQIALDVSTGSTTTSKIVLVNADGGDVKDLGLGCMPSFSRDGGRIVISHPGQGIVMMKSDGTGREVIDGSGWGSQWSPDGKSIACLKGANITLLDVETRQSRQLLVGEAATRYSSLYWSLGWSNDSRFIGFKAQRRDGNKPELCVVEVASSEIKVLHADASTMAVDFMWSPDNEQLVVSFHNPDVQGPQLYSINRKNPGPPQLLPAQPPHYKSHGYAWSRDGKKIVIASMQVPQPIKWVTGPVEGTPETKAVDSR
jgi:hypothetical protein